MRGIATPMSAAWTVCPTARSRRTSVDAMKPAQGDTMSMRRTRCQAAQRDLCSHSRFQIPLLLSFTSMYIILERRRLRCCIVDVSVNLPCGAAFTI